jgi:hypothetical protein
MDDKNLKELKDFIANTVKEGMAPVVDRLNENDLKQNEILNAIGEVQDTQNRALHVQASHIDDHQRRIVKLEKRAA